MRNNCMDTALADAKLEHGARDPRSRALHETARAAMPGGNTRTVLRVSNGSYCCLIGPSGATRPPPCG